MTARPVCPDHPDSRALKARIPTTTRARWVCLKCGKNLGDAGFKAPAQWESTEIGADEIGEVPE